MSTPNTNQTPSQTQTPQLKYPFRLKFGKSNVYELWFNPRMRLDEVLEEAFKLASNGNIVVIRGIIKGVVDQNNVSITILPNGVWRFDVMLGFRNMGTRGVVPNAMSIRPQEIDELIKLLDSAKRIVPKIAEIQAKIFGSEIYGVFEEATQ